MQPECGVSVWKDPCWAQPTSPAWSPLWGARAGCPRCPTRLLSSATRFSRALVLCLPAYTTSLVRAREGCSVSTATAASAALQSPSARHQDRPPAVARARQSRRVPQSPVSCHRSTIDAPGIAAVVSRQRVAAPTGGSTPLGQLIGSTALSPVSGLVVRIPAGPPRPQLPHVHAFGDPPAVGPTTRQARRRACRLPTSAGTEAPMTRHARSAR
jgi:hypothetical protein